MTKAEAKAAMSMHHRQGISLKEAWRRIRGGRGSHGGGHATKQSTSHHSSGGGSTTTRSKPKPRIAVYAGLVGSSAVFLGQRTHGIPLVNVLQVGQGQKLAGLAQNAALITNDTNSALIVAAPTVVGIGASLVADKLGVNRMLAKARMPFRV